MSTSRYWYLECPDCDFVDRWNGEQLRDALVLAGCVKQAAADEHEFLDEMLKVSHHQLACHRCGYRGLALAADDRTEDAFQWPEARLCAGCQAPLDPERLEVFPDTRFCAQCQTQADRGTFSHEDREFCPRCGGVLELRSDGKGRAGGYRYYCSNCRR